MVKISKRMKEAAKVVGESQIFSLRDAIGAGQQKECDW